MDRLLRFALITAVLLAQHAVQVHAFSHVGYPLRDVGPWARAPVSDQPAPDCLAFHCVGSGLPDAVAVPLSVPPLERAKAPAPLPLPRKPRLEFLSRAPPARS